VDSGPMSARLGKGFKARLAIIWGGWGGVSSDVAQGIEFADMQMIAEVYGLCGLLAGKARQQIGPVRAWQRGLLGVFDRGSAAH